MKQLIFTALFIQTLFGIEIQAQDTLFIYTKKECSVCNQTKQVLQTRAITYIEKDVAIAKNATDMLNSLATSGFKGSIYMPVIILGKKLLHPAYQTNNSLVNLDINAVVDSIYKKYTNNKIVQIRQLSENKPALEASQTSNSNCEHASGKIYIIAANYKAENEAISAVEKLVRFGYPNAGFIFENKVYSVFLTWFSNFADASTQLNIEKFKFTDAYLSEGK